MFVYYVVGRDSLLFIIIIFFWIKVLFFLWKKANLANYNFNKSAGGRLFDMLDNRGSRGWNRVGTQGVGEPKGGSRFYGFTFYC